MKTTATVLLALGLSLSQASLANTTSRAEDMYDSLMCYAQSYNACVSEVCKYSEMRQCKLVVCKPLALKACQAQGRSPSREEDRFLLRNYQEG